MAQCLYKNIISKPIKDFTTGETTYTNTFSYCNKLKKRIGKKSCINCKLKVNIDNNNKTKDNE